MEKLMSPVLILGARSDIARAIGHAYAALGCDLILAARNSAELSADSADFATRYNVRAELVDFDVRENPTAFFDRLGRTPQTVVMAVGLLGDQQASESDAEAAALVMETNYNGPALFLLEAARRMEVAGQGTIIGISSVAGDRGRASNFVYGSAKAGLTAFLSGLRGKMSRRAIRVITVKPGFVATSMTAGMALPAKLTAQPEEVARSVVLAHKGKRDVVYVRPIWWLIMFVIRSIPEAIFKRLSL